jgi:hypothetical protein
MEQLITLKTICNLAVLVAHACNPSSSGGKYQEDEVQRQPRQIVCETLSQINLSQRASGVTQGVGPEFKPQYHKKKKIICNLT